MVASGLYASAVPDKSCPPELFPSPHLHFLREKLCDELPAAATRLMEGGKDNRDDSHLMETRLTSCEIY